MRRRYARRTRKTWWTGEDSNLRSSQGAADLQSAAINHSATCAETPILRLNHSFRQPAPALNTRETYSCGQRACNKDGNSARHTRARKPLHFGKIPLECVGNSVVPPTRRRAKHLPETFPGAGEGTRTPDPLITNQMLYQLSYASSMRQLRPRGVNIPLIPS